MFQIVPSETWGALSLPRPWGRNQRVGRNDDTPASFHKPLASNHGEPLRCQLLCTHISTIRRAVPFISQRETYNVGLIT